MSSRFSSAPILPHVRCHCVSLLPLARLIITFCVPACQSTTLFAAWGPRMGSIEDFLNHDVWWGRFSHYIWNKLSDVISRKDVGGGSIQSTLVETVSINYEDFNESFLTCSTCLCEFWDCLSLKLFLLSRGGYDGGERCPKLLPCSHTVCISCLKRIIATDARELGFRFPISLPPLYVRK